nr:MAG TPA: hypothetical protein [Caudoviricetes sp.]
MRHRRAAWGGRDNPPHRTRTGMRLRMPAMRADHSRMPCGRRRPHHVRRQD